MRIICFDYLRKWESQPQLHNATSSSVYIEPCCCAQVPLKRANQAYVIAASTNSTLFGHKIVLGYL